VPKRVLVVEQTDVVRDGFATALRSSGVDVYSAKTVPEAAALFAKYGASVVVLDLLLMAEDAFVFMAGILGALPNTKIVATTASGAMRQASMAIEQGAFDYLVKPIDSQRFVEVVENAAARRDPANLKDEIPYHEAIFGDAWAGIYRLAPNLAPVLIEGETGTGKAQCAHAMHTMSSCSDRSFLSIDCERTQGLTLKSLFSVSLLKEGGTLHLKEPSRLSLSLQTQLLRFLQSPVFDGDPFGDLHSNIRIIATTSGVPEDDVDAGRFREDLFYRLKVVRFSLDPLWKRVSEVPHMAQAIADHLALDTQMPTRKVSEDLALVLKQFSWSQNLTQLTAALRYVVTKHHVEVLKTEMLPPPVLESFLDSSKVECERGPTNLAQSVNSTILELVKAGWPLADMERLLIETAIAQNGGSIPKASQQLCVSPSTLYRKREAWGGSTP
jgi:DNA-binding NtrC family response regulator